MSQYQHIDLLEAEPGLYHTGGGGGEGYKLKVPSHIQEVEANPGSQEEEEEMVVEEEKTEKGKDSVLEAQEIAKKILGNNYSDGGRWIILGAIGGQWLATSVSDPDMYWICIQ